MERLALPGFDPEPDMLAYTTLSYGQAQTNLSHLVKSVAEANHATAKASKKNEATIRLQIIDVILFNCLGWNREDCIPEDFAGPGYIDYTLSTTRPVLIIEAKKEGISFALPPISTLANREITLGSLKKGNEKFKEAVDQVTKYCVLKGINIAVITNGQQWVACAPTRTDGIAPDNGRCYVVSDLNTMLADFPQVWRLLSRDGISAGNLNSYIFGDATPRLPNKLSQSLINYPGVKGRNTYQANLQNVSEIVLEDITKAHELEPEFIRECYCMSGALSQYSLIAKAILKERYVQIFDNRIGGPNLQPANHRDDPSEILKEVATKRPILLIGDVGVGKSMFIKHLLTNEVLASEAIVIYLDLGYGFALTENLNLSVMSSIEEILLEKYNIDIRENGIVRGIYHGDIKRFERSVFKDLKEKNIDAYRIREIKLLEQKMKELDKHLGAAISHIVNGGIGQKRQIVIILDNCDQRTEQTQQEAFLIAQEIAEKWPVTVFLALRPETYNASRSHGTLSAYHPKAFTIAPPRLDEVIEKRLQFGLRITSGEIPLGVQYGGGNVSFPHLQSLLNVLLNSLKENVTLIECIDNISGGNVRLALDIVRGFLGSGHINTQKIDTIFETTGHYIIPLHEFIRAIIYKDSIYYNPSDSPIANLFDVSRPDSKEHFLQLFILGLLRDLKDHTVEGGFIKSARLYSEIQSLGFTAEQTDGALTRLVRKKLVEASARRLPEPGQSHQSALRITSVGMYHLMKISRQFTYYDAIVVDTPVFDVNARNLLKDVQTIEERTKRAEIFLAYLDQVWSELNLPQNWFDWDTTKKDALASIRQARHDSIRIANATNKGRPKKAESRRPDVG